MSVNTNYLTSNAHVNTMVSLALMAHDQKNPGFLEAAIEHLNQYSLTQEQNNKIVGILQNVPSNNPTEASSLMRGQIIQVLSGEAKEVISQSQKTDFSLLELPTDPIHEILLSLSMRDVSACGLVCKKSSQIIQSASLWKRLFNRDFLSSYPTQDFSLGYYNACKNSFTARSNLEKGIYASHAFEAHKEGGIYSLFAAEGKLFSSSGCMIKAWSLETGECLRVFGGRFTGHIGTVRSVIVANGKLFSSSQDGTIRIWDIETGTCLKTLDHKEAVFSLTLANGKLCSGNGSHTGDVVRVWNVETGECLNTFMGGGDSGICSIASDRGKLFSAAWGSAINAWNVETGERLNTFGGLNSHIVSLTVSEGKLFAACYDGSIEIWDIETEKCLKTFKKHIIDHPDRIVVADGRLFAGSSEGIEIRDLETGSHVNIIPGIEKVMWSLIFVEGKLFSGSIYDKIFIYDFKAKHDVIFTEIVRLFKRGTLESTEQAIDRFSRMPKKARDKIYGELYQILKPFTNDYYGCAEHAFHDQHGLHATPAEKAQAIANYLAKEV